MVQLHGFLMARWWFVAVVWDGDRLAVYLA
jgi:hypothetical protein